MSNNEKPSRYKHMVPDPRVRPGQSVVESVLNAILDRLNPERKLVPCPVSIPASTKK